MARDTTRDSARGGTWDRSWDSTRDSTGDSTGATAGNSTPETIQQEAAYDFSWRLSGERAVAPLQVFDDGRRTWLHFAPGQPLPAIFAVGRHGERPVPYRRRDPYVVIDGVWPALVMRGGSLRALARRQVGAASDDAADFATEPAADTTTAYGAARIPQAAVAGTAIAARIATNPTIGSPGPGQSAAPLRAGSPPMGGAQPRVAITPAYHAEISDGNLRRVLARWAGLAGWTFGPEHWDVDVDIPLAGGASFGDDFKQAVRALVSATEMAERPLQPCFYANRVLRVVPYAHACDRAATREAAT
ncbi:TcpQ domain-containing protein [Bordetella sp. LUAb4]|uniref:TcpQ domain-containing protein n=1 Tax=Bordetella sp. LUAb4 TaxID=2843195 RepID=UPI001E45E058|nr:TcpQ domain-containing protein [Bordetella sp. LUAb4]